MEIKSIASNIRDLDSAGRTVTGYFAAYGNRDSDGDIIQKGAFAKTIAERGPTGLDQIKNLLDHDILKSVGKITVLKEDDFGLYYESKIGRHALGQDYLMMCEDGLISNHSIGFRTVKETKQSSDTNLITEIKLYEGSGIQFLAANTNTPLTGFKSFEEVFEMIKKLDKALHVAEYTDETFIMIEERLKSLNETVSEILTKNSTIQTPLIVEATKPSLDTLPDDVNNAQVIEEVKKINYAKLFKTALS